MPDVKLTFESVLLVIAVILLFASTISVLNKGRKDWREISGQDRRQEEIDRLDKRVSKLETGMDEVKDRLQQGEENFQQISNDTEQIMNVLDGMLMHFISGNDKEKLKNVKNDLDHYKNARR